MTEKLKPCPFCGNDTNLRVEKSSAGTWVINCRDCDATGPWYSDDGDAETPWNTRPREERLEAALREIAKQPPHTMDCVGIARRALEEE